MKWISVDDDMPDAGDRVLVFCESMGVQMCHRAYFNGTTTRWVMTYDMSLAYLNITHWMPLPEPPESN